MKTITSLAALVLGATLASTAFAQDKTGDNAQPSDEEAQVKEDQTVMPSGHDITPSEMMDGRWYNEEGIPTFKIEEDGTVDYATFSGYRRYSAECHVCHGPDGEGSTYAPALKESVLQMDYYDFLQVVASGKQEVNSASNQVMPAFGTNKNVWCYIDDIYAYLLARGTDSIPRGRPAKKADKPEEFAEVEDACMSM